MAIADVARYAHLSQSDITALGEELDAIRRDIEDSRGVRDAVYIRRTILFQRTLEAVARLLIWTSRSRFSWLLGTASLALAKSVENMEIGHNVDHGQWDWMNDPEIHSTTWEWDMAGVSSQWRYSHNYRHHVFTNVIGVDDDLGFGVLRVTRDQEWRRNHLYQPVRNMLLAIMFEWGIAMHGLHSEHDRATTDAEKSAYTRALIRKMARQAGKDYVFFPALSLRRWHRTLTANLAANLLRNVWAYVVICCGHFADGAEKFTPAALEGETKPEWYLRQMLGTATFDAGPVMAFLSGNLCYQIEHHLYPDLPSNRLHEISVLVRQVCDKYDLPYTTGSFLMQYGKTWRTIAKLSLPDRYLRATVDDAPETRSERMFAELEPGFGGTDPSTGRRRGLNTAIATVRGWRENRRANRAVAA